MIKNHWNWFLLEYGVNIAFAFLNKQNVTERKFCAASIANKYRYEAFDNPTNNLPLTQHRE